MAVFQRAELPVIASITDVIVDNGRHSLFDCVARLLHPVLRFALTLGSKLRGAE